MLKNGKNKKCIFCSREFYVAKGLLKVRKYCSKKCSNSNSYLDRARIKECSICSSTYTSYSSNQGSKNICSKNCAKINNRVNQLKFYEMKKNTTKEVICKFCGKKVITNEYSPSSFCGGKGGNCMRGYLSKSRMGEKNPAYRNGLAVKGTRNYTGLHLRACSKYRKDFLTKSDYLYCEVCGVNSNGTQKFEVHHIYFASLYPKHEELHNFKNLILICIQCHNDFHSYKNDNIFKELETSRGLKELFKKKI